MAKQKSKETEASAEVAVETGADNQTASHAFDQIEELRAEAQKWKDAHGEACALVARIHAAAVGEVTGPKRGVVEDVEDVVNGLRVRVAELEAEIRSFRYLMAAVESQPLKEAPSLSDDKDLIADAYDLFRKSQAEGDFPAWPELPEQTQKLWRDSYAHVTGGGEPRTDYEEAVRYLISSAQ